ncbi:3',5'-cyclic-nucleotide phosphodiesterase [Sorochytrium milnesiophthora]
MMPTVFNYYQNVLGLLPQYQLVYQDLNCTFSPLQTVEQTIGVLQTGVANATIIGTIGPAYSASVEPMALAASYFQMPVCDGGATATELADLTAYPNFVRTIPADNIQAVALAALVNRFGWRRISVIYSQDSYGSGIYQALKASLASGTQILSSYGFSSDIQDWGPVVQGVVDAQANIILFLAYSKSFHDMLPTATAANLFDKNYVWIFPDSGADLLNYAPASWLENILAVYPAEGGGVGYTQFMNYYNALDPTRFYKPALFPGPYLLFFQTCIELYARAYDALLVGNTTPSSLTLSQVMDTIISLKFESTVGSFGFYVQFGVYNVSSDTITPQQTPLFKGNTTIPPPDLIFLTTQAKWIIGSAVTAAILCVIGGVVGYMYYRKAVAVKIMRMQLARLNSKSLARPIDLRGPVSRVIEILEKLKAPNAKLSIKATEIEELVDALTSDNIFAPRLDSVSDAAGAHLDSETRNYLSNLVNIVPATTSSLLTSGGDNNELGSGNTGPRRKNSSSVVNVSPGSKLVNSKGSSEASMSKAAVAAGISRLMQRQSGSQLKLQKSASLQPLGTAMQQVLPLHLSGSALRLNADTALYLENFDEWTFDTLEFSTKCNGKPIYHIGYLLLERYDLLSHFNLDPDRVRRFLVALESSYRDVPYHSSAHGADVLHAFHCLMLKYQYKSFTPLEILSAIIACLGHDVDHPGVNNMFLQRSRHPWAILYSDRSINEFHHTAFLFQLLNSPEHSQLLEGLTPDQYDEFRRHLITMILCTDMSKHFEYLTKFKAKMTSQAFAKLETPENRLSVMEMANPAKISSIALKWTNAVMEEFFAQGDQELQLGFPISQFMDRRVPNVPKCQIGFIDILVSPLYEVWAQYSVGETSAAARGNIAKNREYWSSHMNSLLNIQKNRSTSGGVGPAGAVSPSMSQSSIKPLAASVSPAITATAVLTSPTSSTPSVIHNSNLGSIRATATTDTAQQDAPAGTTMVDEAANAANSLISRDFKSAFAKPSPSPAAAPLFSQSDSHASVPVVNRSAPSSDPPSRSHPQQPASEGNAEAAPG